MRRTTPVYYQGFGDGILDNLLNPVGAIVGAISAGSHGGAGSGATAASTVNAFGLPYGQCPPGMIPKTQSPGYAALSAGQAAAMPACVAAPAGTAAATAAAPGYPGYPGYPGASQIGGCRVNVGAETHRCSQAGWQNALASAQRRAASGMDPQMSVVFGGRVFNIPSCLTSQQAAATMLAPLATLNAQGQFSCPSGQSTAYNTQNQVVCVASTTARRPTSGSSKGKRSSGKGGRRTKGMRGVFGSVADTAAQVGAGASGSKSPGWLTAILLGLGTLAACGVGAAAARR